MSAHQEPTYKDALAVTAGLERLTEDLPPSPTLLTQPPHIGQSVRRCS